jgi:hypothetical protein
MVANPTIDIMSMIITPSESTEKNRYGEYGPVELTLYAIIIEQISATIEEITEVHSMMSRLLAIRHTPAAIKKTAKMITSSIRLLF